MYIFEIFCGEKIIGVPCLLRWFFCIAAGDNHFVLITKGC